jgi:hypothetical protein
VNARLPPAVHACTYCRAPLAEPRKYCDRTCNKAHLRELRGERESKATQAARAGAICEDCRGPIDAPERGKIPKRCAPCTKRHRVERKAADRQAKSRLRGFVRRCVDCKAVVSKDDPGNRTQRCEPCNAQHHAAYQAEEKRATRLHERLVVLTERAGGRPQTRGDCEGGPRPCPWVSCRYNLALDVHSTGYAGNTPHVRLNPTATQSCALDVAARGGQLLEQVGEALGMTRERVRQIEDRALAKLKTAGLPLRELLDEREVTRGEQVDEDNDEDARGLSVLWSTSRDELAGIRRAS